MHRGQRIGIECKRTDAPRLSRSMRIAFEDLELSRLIVLYPGRQRYPLGDGIDVVPLAALAEGGEGLLGDVPGGAQPTKPATTASRGPLRR